MQEMVIYGVSFDMVGKQPIVLLKTVSGNKFLPIWIGHAEAAAILMKLQGAETPRPMTHDLLTDVFGITTPLSPHTADAMYDAIAGRLTAPDFRPRALFTRFNIEVLATTESPLDELAAHGKLAADGWGGPGGRVRAHLLPAPRG